MTTHPRRSTRRPVREALHGTMSKVGTVLAGVAAGGVLALGAAMVQGVKDAQSYQSLQLKSAAVLKSTGNVAGRR
jgi:formate hydrogenlyase subunit 3/multisubunit Na+/H+ antiporter MnhD subunit